MMFGGNAGLPRPPVPYGLGRDMQRLGYRSRSAQSFNEFGIGHGTYNTRNVDIINPINTWREFFRRDARFGP